jgi:hypothetical protein
MTIRQGLCRASQCLLAVMLNIAVYVGYASCLGYSFGTGPSSVKGYTKSDGTAASGYTHTPAGTESSGRSSGTSHRTPMFLGIPHIAEDGSICGSIDPATGRPKTVLVSGYYRRDGTYVQEHYSSPSRANEPAEAHYAPEAPGYSPPAASGMPAIAENGSVYGEISSATGRPKTVLVSGYYRQDGTYVRGYYRSPPGATATEAADHGPGAPSYPIPSLSGKPSVAENGSVYGEISPATGRPKTVLVSGYYRQNGDYVQGHYRSPPRR